MSLESTSLRKQLKALLDEAPPERIVLLSADGAAAAGQDLVPGAAHSIQCVSEIAEHLDPPRAALVVLEAVWLQRAAAAGHLERDLAALRDLYAEAVIAIADSECPLAAEQWRALGFRPWQHDSDSGTTLQGFNLYDYKQRPDWLNAKYWANPELWDVYRW